MNHTILVAITLFGSYAVLYGLQFFWNLLLRAPVALDHESTLESQRSIRNVIEEKRFSLNELGRQKAREIEELKGHLAEGRSSLAKCLEDFARKHPHEEHLERKVASAFTQLEEHDTKLIAWLLDAGKTTRGQIQSAGFSFDKINQKSGMPIISDEITRSANGTELLSHHEINPALLQAIRNVLYPNRPVTPLQQ